MSAKDLLTVESSNPRFILQKLSDARKSLSLVQLLYQPGTPDLSILNSHGIVLLDSIHFSDKSAFLMRTWGPKFWPFLRSSARAPTIKVVRGTVAIKGVFDN